jgi:LisH domain-containing protein ARMC9
MIMQLFDQGSRDAFFSKFSQFVPLAMRSKDPQTMQMEFYIQIYFFVYHIHPALGKKKLPDAQAKQYFSAYLEGRGAALSKEA